MASLKTAAGMSRWRGPTGGERKKESRCRRRAAFGSEPVRSLKRRGASSRSPGNTAGGEGGSTAPEAGQAWPDRNPAREKRPRRKNRHHGDRLSGSLSGRATALGERAAQALWLRRNVAARRDRDPGGLPRGGGRLFRGEGVSPGIGGRMTPARRHQSARQSGETQVLH